MTAVATRLRPWPEQAEAIRSVVSEIVDGGSTQLILPCGMGKSIVALLTAEELLADLTVVAVPSLALLAQTLRLWQAETDRAALAVCSDETVAYDEGPPDAIEQLRRRCLVASDAELVAEHVSTHRRTVVLTTYHSLATTGRGLRSAGRTADLLVADEAHRCATTAGTTFASALDPTTLRARRRLFMTATPRVTSERARKRAHQEQVRVIGMDDSEFGPVAYQMPFAAAIRSGRLCDYKLVTMLADDRRHEQLAALERAVQFEDASINSATLATAGLLLDAVDAYGLRRIVTFHNRVVDAQRFAAVLPLVARHLGRREPITAAVSGEQVESERDAALNLLRVGDPARAVVVSNAKCLSEGVDIPALDAVLFAAARNSVVDILQPIGRALRRPPGKTTSYVIVPVILDGPLSEDTSATRQPEFDIVWSVARASRP